MNSSGVSYKHCCFFQGVRGPTGPPGAKGIAGEPVSLLFTYMNVPQPGSRFDNELATLNIWKP